MNWFSFALIISSVSISAFAQLVLKSGVSGPRFQDGVTKGGLLEIAWLIMTSPLIIGGFFLYGAGAIVWLFVLSKTDVSQAYPFVGLGFIITLFFSAVALGETVNAARIIGTLLIIAGIVFIARS